MDKSKNKSQWQKESRIETNEAVFATIILCLGTVLVFLSPFIYLGNNFHFSELSNNIGGTIGGITAPFSSILGSVLVYLALRAQIRANETLRKQIVEQNRKEAIQNNRQFLLDQFRLIRRDINEFSAVTNGGVVKGAEGINVSLIHIKDIRRTSSDQLIMSSNYHELLGIIRALIDLSDQIASSDIDSEDKNNLNKLIRYLVELKITPAFDANRINVADESKAPDIRYSG